jgi:hypothetical protein
MTNMENKLLKQLNKLTTKDINESVELCIQELDNHIKFYKKATKEIKKYDWIATNEALTKVTNTICSNAYKVSDLRIEMSIWNGKLNFHIKGILHYPNKSKEGGYDLINQTWLLNGVNSINEHRYNDIERDLPNIIKLKE